MNREQQDLAWGVLPKEFKEEVKKLYRKYTFTREGYYVELFGLHNLTSDADREEMLTVPRSQMQKLYASTKKVNDPSSKDYINGILNTLDTLFGSKCLPDDADSSERKENRCEKCGVPNSSICAHMNCQDYPSQSEPKSAKPEEKSRNLSQETANCDKHFDNILKDSFRNERRLNIATQIMSGILSNQRMLNNLAYGETMAEDVVKCVVNTTMMYTDALISECEKGGSDGN